MRWLLVVPLSALLLAWIGPGLVWSQPSRREKAEERLEILRMWKMMEALDLDKVTADKMFKIRSKYIKIKNELRQSIRSDFRQLRQKLREPSGTNEQELTNLLKSIREKRKRLQSLWEQQYEEVSKVLSVRQQAELLLFLKDFSRQIRSVLHRRRHGPPPPGALGPPGRPGHGPPAGGPPGPPLRPDASDDVPEG
jgi:Spy/CpxP family protein refolding chaperone